SSGKLCETREVPVVRRSDTDETSQVHTTTREGEMRAKTAVSAVGVPRGARCDINYSSAPTVHPTPQAQRPNRAHEYESNSSDAAESCNERGKYEYANGSSSSRQVHHHPEQ